MPVNLDPNTPKIQQRPEEKPEKSCLQKYVEFTIDANTIEYQSCKNICASKWEQHVNDAISFSKFMKHCQRECEDKKRLLLYSQLV